ncbi:MAG: hypothetical protein ACT4OJ_01760 [Bacteroidota bacterium]
MDKLRATDDPAVLEELSNLFQLQEPETVYQVTPPQKKAIDEARQQVKDDKLLSNEQADKEADEWLNE